MGPIGYVLLFVGALAGGFVSGLAGFGTALMALGIWLYILPPSAAVPLVLICSVVAQTATLPSMWKSFDLTLVWPFLIGGLLGVPLGTMLVAHADPNIFKLTVGILLLVFPTALYFSAPMAFEFGGKIADGDCRLHRRHSRRPRRPVRSTADPVGKRSRLGQGRASRRVPDLQLDGTVRRALFANREWSRCA